MKFLRLSLKGLDATDQDIYIEQLREHWRLDVWAIPGQFIALLAFIPVISRSALTLSEWVGPVGLLLATWSWGSLSLWRLRHVHITPVNYSYWRTATLFREITQSGGWGALGALLWGALPPQWHLLILTGLIVFAFTAVFFSTHDSGVAVATTFPILLILLVRLLFDGSEGTGTIALILSLSMLTCLAVGKLIEAKLLDGERLRRRNEQLLKDLAEEVEKVKLAKEAAEHANRQKSEFIAAASHDLRQPLHSLTLLSGLISAELQGQTSQSTADKINASVSALRIIFEQLFDIARVDANKLPHRPQVCTVQDIVGSLDHEFAALCQDKGLGWQCLMDRQNKGPWVQADPLFVQRILRNLLENALRYTPQGRLGLRVRHRGRHVAIQVWDSGIGIARADRQRIFEDYTQLHNAGRQLQEGLGLGLGLVRRLIQAGSYGLVLRSKVGRGTCFNLLLPTAPEPARTARESTATAHPPSHEANIGCALLIEDAVDVRETMALVIRQGGWQCFDGATASEAVSALAKADAWPDLVISDYRLSDQSNGMEAIAAIRHDFGLALPALLVTGDMDNSLAERAANAHIRLLRKPLSPDEMLAAMAQSLRQQAG